MKAIHLFGKMLSFSRLKITTDNLDDIKNELSAILKNNAASVPVVIDSEVALDLPALVEMLWTLDIQPIGVVEGVLTESAKALRLATFPADGKRIERLPTQQSTANPTDAPKTDETNAPNADVMQATASEVRTADIARVDTVRGVTSSVHNQMLRSGQSLQHLGGDLVVIGGVNNGAEAITDNSLHVYGHGQGRLVAGATGDKDARIFCQKFNPSLVSVAGTYCLRDAIPSEMIDKAVQVRYDEEKGLVFSLMTN